MGKHWKYKGRWISFLRSESDWHFKKLVCFEAKLLVYFTVKRTVSAGCCELCHSWERMIWLLQKYTTCGDFGLGFFWGGGRLFCFDLFVCLFWGAVGFFPPTNKWRQSEVYVVVVIPNLKFSVVFITNLVLDWIFNVLFIF